MGSVSGVIPFGQAEVHVGYDRSESKRRLSSATRSSDQQTVEQFKVDAPVQPVQADGDVHHGLVR